MIRTRTHPAAALLASVAFASAACSGGSVSAPQAGADGSSRHGVRLTLTIPAPVAAPETRRRVDYISPSTASVAIAALYPRASPGPASVFDVSTGSPLCATSGGARTCTLTIAVLPGASEIDVSGYVGSNGSGALLEHALVTLPSASGPVVDLDVQLGADVHGLTLVLASGEFIAGVPGTQTLTVTAMDAGGNTVPATTAFDVPIALAASDDAILLSPSTVSAAGVPVVVFYNGDPSATSVITATVAGVSAATAVIRVVGSGPPPTPGPTTTPNPNASAIVIVH